MCKGIAPPRDVRFEGWSGRVNSTRRCPLMTQSGHAGLDERLESYVAHRERIFGRIFGLVKDNQCVRRDVG